jgi:hypothetical protein
MPTSLEHTIAALPGKPTCEYLITSYFQHISPFFHILHGPTFQEQYRAYSDSPLTTDFAWLALLFLICSITVNTLEEDDPAFCALRSGLRPAGLAGRRRVTLLSSNGHELSLQSRVSRLSQPWYARSTPALGLLHQSQRRC